MTGSNMPRLRSLTTAALFACGIAGSASAHDTVGTEAAHDREPHSPAASAATGYSLLDALYPSGGVHSSSFGDTARAVLQGERGTAHVNSDTVELKNGAVYLNGHSYGAVTPAQTVEYTVTQGRRTLMVDGKERSPVP